VLSLWQFLYRFVFIPLLWLALQVLGMVNEKVRRGIRGRVNLFGTLALRLSSVRQGKRIWIHSSSMGEFEQAKPIIAELKRRHPELVIVVTFFSPSGYEHSKRYPLADVITYLPFDTRAGARRFFDLIRPQIAVMIRYDIWPNHIWEARRRGIPLIIANATMRRQTLRRLPLVRRFHHHVFDSFATILTVSDADREAFGYFAVTRPTLESIGDTRYDQVLARSNDAKQRHLLQSEVIRDKLVFVVGSSWPEDEEVILPVFYKLQQTFPTLLLILVPHEPTVTHLEELEDELAGKTSHIRFSLLNDYTGERVIIVDSVGILLALYNYATVAYVGGSFRQGIHNVLEAAVYGIPVLFGPRHRNSQEPLMLVDQGGGFVVNSPQELYRALRHLLEEPVARAHAGERAAQFVSTHTGATERFMAHLDPILRGSVAEGTHRS
jgi:3-deoxy-D-manno-octulosonic-acid transferase